MRRPIALVPASSLAAGAASAQEPASEEAQAVRHSIGCEATQVEKSRRRPTRPPARSASTTSSR